MDYNLEEIEHSTNGNSKSRVAYFYDAEVGKYSYGCDTVFKPHRVRMTHDLVASYGLFKKMDVYKAPAATFEQMQIFHSEEYLKFLEQITPSTMASLPPKKISLMVEYGLGDEQPIFPGVYNYTSAVTGASLCAASLLNNCQADIAVNWSGGMHHAKRGSASGFCYVNDCVLAVLELLKFHTRVLYVDIDVHHGDGVEEAFYCTNRVMTLSFHYYAENFFPSTGGSMQATGDGEGKNYALNFPLKEGIDDETYKSVFKATINAVMEYYRPEAIVMQCGADSLAGDRLGRAAKSNLSIEGHAACVKYIKNLGLPLLILGGGGYTLSNVSRCWANETGELLGIKLPNIIPDDSAYKRFYGPNFELRLPAHEGVKNANSLNYLQRAQRTIIETMKACEGAPGIQIKEDENRSNLLPLSKRSKLDQTSDFPINILKE